MTQPDEEPGTAAAVPEPTAATLVPPSAETTDLVPPAPEPTETVSLPLSGSAPHPAGPYPAGPHPGAPYPAGPYPTGPYPGPGPFPPPQAAAPYPYSQYPTSAVPSSTMPPAYPAPYAYPYPAPPAPPARKGYGLLVAVTVGVVVLVLLGGVATVVLVSRTHGSPLAGADPGRPPATPTPTPSRTPTPFSGDLRTVLLPVPAGATKLSNATIGNADGTVTINQAAATYNGDNTVVDYLKSMGYAQGATVGWRTPSTNATVHVLLFQFHETMSERWLRGIVDGFNGSDRVDARGDLNGVPGGRYYVFTHTSNDRAYAIECYYIKYDIAVDIWMFTPDKPDPANLTALAQQQYALLP